MAEEKFTVVVREDGSVEVSKKIGGIGKSAEDSNKAVDLLKKTLATLGIGLGIKELAEYADTYAEITNNVRNNTKSVEELTAVTNRLFDISQKTRTSFAGNAELYDRLASSAKELGATQNELLGFIEATDIALKLQGGATELSRRGVIQLFQALRTGNVDAGNLNAILVQTPEIAQAAADGLKGAGGSVARLTALITAGKVSAKEFFNAVISQVPELGEKLTRLAPTISGAFAVLNNSVVNFLGKLDQSSGVSRAFGSAIIFIADHIDAFAKGLTILGIALATYFAPSFILGIATAFKALTAAMLANPFTAIITLIAIIVSSLILFKDELAALSEPTKTVIIDIAKFLDNAVGMFYGAVNVIGEAWSHLGPILGHYIIETANIVLGGIQSLIDGSVDLLNKFSTSLGGAGTIAPPKIVLDDPYKDALKDTGEAAGKVYAQSFGTGFQDLAKSVLKPKGAAGGAGANLDNPLGKQVVTLSQQQQSSFDALLKTLDPVRSAMVEVAKAQQLINLAMQAGVITTGEAGKLQQLLALKYKDQLDPLRAVNVELDRQTALLRLNNDQRDVQSQLFDLTKKLREQGIILDASETSALTKKLELLQQVNKESKIQDQILQDIKGPAESYANTLKVLNQLLADNVISTVQYNEKLLDSRIAFLDTQTDAASGFERAGLKMQKSADDLATTMEEGLTDAANTAADALANFAMTGQLNFKQLVNSILSDITRLAAKSATNSLFGGLFGGGGGGGGGGGFGGLFSGLFGSGAPAGNAIGPTQQGIFGSLFSSLGFANTGSFTVGGTGGPDSQMVSFRGSPGETVSVNKPGSGAGGNGNQPNINFYVSTPDANSFNRSQGQLMARAQASMTRAQRRNS